MESYAHMLVSIASTFSWKRKVELKKSHILVRGNNNKIACTCPACITFYPGHLQLRQIHQEKHSDHLVDEYQYMYALLELFQADIKHPLTLAGLTHLTPNCFST